MSDGSVYLSDRSGMIEATANWYQTQEFLQYPRRRPIILTAEKILGKGAFSIVVKVDCEGRKWAVKQPMDSKEAELVTREAALLKSLNDKEKKSQEYVVQAIALLRLNDDPLLVMKFYKGGDLLSRVSKMPTGLALVNTLRVAKQLLGALAFLKEERIIHRDLKLANIFYEQGDEVKLGDFGLSMREGDQQELSILCGTPKAMSPELLQAYHDRALIYPYGSSSDVWALGCVFFQVFSGYQLFPGEQVSNWTPRLQKQQEKLPSELEHLLDVISTNKHLRGSRELSFFKTAIRGMLELDPAKRLTPEDALIMLSGQEPFEVVEKEDVPTVDLQQENPGLESVQDNQEARQSYILIEQEDVLQLNEPNPTQDNTTTITAVFGFFESIALELSRWLRG